MLRALAGLRNYVSTYGVLIGAFSVSRPWQLAPMLVGSVIAAGLYPLPFVIVVATIFAYFGGETDVSLPLVSGLPTVSPEIAIISAAVIGTIAYVLALVVSNRIIKLNLEWQNQLFKKFVRDVAVGARLDRITPAFPTRPRAVLATLVNAIRAGALVARLLSHGLYNMAIILIAIVALCWFRIEFLGIAVGVSVLFLPIYAGELRKVVSVRRSMDEVKPAARGKAVDVLEGAFGAGDDLGLEERLDGLPVHELEALYGVTNHQYRGLNSIQFWSSVHVFTVITTLLIMGYTAGWSFGAAEGFAAVALLLAVRSGAGLIGLLANITRNYLAIQLLKSLLSPPSKLLQVQDADHADYVLASGEQRYRLVRGQSVFFSCYPRPDATIQIGWLINTLMPTRPATEAGRRTVRFHPDMIASDSPTPATDSEACPVVFLPEQELREFNDDRAFQNWALDRLLLVWVRDRSENRVSRYNLESIFVDCDAQGQLTIERLDGGVLESFETD